jgi:PAS domain S-box-containing protein
MGERNNEERMGHAMLRVLALAAEPEAIRLLSDALVRHANPTFEVALAGTLAEGLERLGGAPFDAAVLGPPLPDGCGETAAATLRARFPLLPIVALASTPAAEPVHLALRLDAEDRVLTVPAVAELIPRAILFAVERERAERARREAEQRFRTFADGLGLDVAERMPAEEALRRSQEELRTICDCAPIMMCVLDTDRRVLYANRAFTQFTGVSEEELKGGRACGVLGCINALDDPRGCGFGPACATCRMRLAMEETLKTGIGHRDVEYRATLERDGVRQTVVILGSTARVQAAGHSDLLLCLQDITPRLQAEQALRESEEKYRAVVEDQTEIICRFREDGTFTFVNEVFCRFVGKPAGELIGNTWHSIAAAEDLPRVEEILRALCPSNPVISIENRVYAGTGEVHWMQFVNRGFFDPQGRLTEIQSVGRDITERKRAEESLRLSEAKWRSYIENAPVGVIVADSAGRHVEANRFAEAMLGYGPGELLHTSVADLPAEEAADSALLHFAEVMTNGRADGQFLLRRKDGRRIWASVRASRIPGDRFLAVFQDITERRRADDALRDSEERNRSLIASSLDAVLLTTLDGRILAANEAACRMFGRSEEELMRLGRSGVVDASDPRLAQALEERGRSGRYCGDLTLVRSDGTRFPAEISSAVFVIRDSQLRSSMVIRDTTERRRAEEQLRASREQLRALSARLQAVREEERTSVAREIHDVLAQELTRLKIDLVWLQGRVGNTGKAAAPAALAARVSEMAGVADMAIRSVQRIATALRPAVLDSLGLCAAVEWQARDFQEHAGIPCNADVPDAELPADRDSATAAFRILQESLTNVLRHAQATRVDVLLRQDAGQLLLRIQDNGRGIPPETLNNPLSIGLAGMRERASLLGGQFAISSLPGSGTTVEVRLPFSKTAVSQE